MHQSDKTQSLASIYLNEFQNDLQSVRRVIGKQIINSGTIQINDASQEGVKIDTSQFDLPITLEVNCIKLILYNCHFKDLTLVLNRCDALDISNCSMEKLEVRRPNIGGRPNVSIRDNPAISTSNIGHLNFQIQQELNFMAECTTIGQISGYQCTGGLYLTLLGCDINEQGGKALSFSGGPFNVVVKLEQKTKVHGEIEMLKCQNINMNIADSAILGRIEFIDCPGTILSTSQGSEIGSIVHGGASSLSSTIVDTSVNEWVMESLSVNGLTIENTTKGVYKIGEITFNKCTLSANTHFRNCTISRLKFSHSDNRSILRISNSTIASSFDITDSLMGETFLQNVLMGRNMKFRLLNSNIMQSEFHTVDWMDNYQLVTEPKEYTKGTERIRYYLSLKESYRQLKAVSQEALNRFDALNFQRHEQHIQKELYWLKRNYFDHFLLKTNELFNNYGLSYVRPLVWGLVFHSIFFIGIVLLGGANRYPVATTLSNLDWGFTFGKALPDFLILTSPLHSSDYLSIRGWWPALLDMGMRISSGYFIYYFLSASRKFHLK